MKVRTMNGTSRPLFRPGRTTGACILAAALALGTAALPVQAQVAMDGQRFLPVRAEDVAVVAKAACRIWSR